MKCDAVKDRIHLMYKVMVGVFLSICITCSASLEGHSFSFSSMKGNRKVVGHSPG
jgi:hypothetical protein